VKEMIHSLIIFAILIIVNVNGNCVSDNALTFKPLEVRFFPINANYPKNCASRKCLGTNWANFTLSAEGDLVSYRDVNGSCKSKVCNSATWVDTDSVSCDCYFREKVFTNGQSVSYWDANTCLSSTCSNAGMTVGQSDQACTSVPCKEGGIQYTKGQNRTLTINGTCYSATCLGSGVSNSAVIYHLTSN
jgi:hypothetical protein